MIRAFWPRWNNSLATNRLGQFLLSPWVGWSIAGLSLGLAAFLAFQLRQEKLAAQSLKLLSEQRLEASRQMAASFLDATTAMLDRTGRTELAMSGSRIVLRNQRFLSPQDLEHPRWQVIEAKAQALLGRALLESGSYQAARVQLEEARLSYEKLLETTTSPRAFLLPLSEVFRNLAQGAYDTGHMAESEFFLRRALAHLEVPPGNNPTTTDILIRQRAWLQLHLARSVLVQKRTTETEELLQLATEAIHKHGDDQSALWLWLSSELYQTKGDLARELQLSAQAADSFSQSVAIARQLIELYPTSWYYRLRLAWALGSLGDEFLDQGNTTQAKALLTESRTLRAQLQNEAPDQAQMGPLISWLEVIFADLAETEQDNSAAESAYRQGISTLQKSLEFVQDQPAWIQQLWYIWKRLGSFYRRQRDPAMALNAFQQAFLLREQLYGLFPQDLNRRHHLFRDLSDIATLQIVSGEHSTLPAIEVLIEETLYGVQFPDAILLSIANSRKQIQHLRAFRDFVDGPWKQLAQNLLGEQLEPVSWPWTGQFSGEKAQWVIADFSPDPAQTLELRMTDIPEKHSSPLRLSLERLDAQTEDSPATVRLWRTPSPVSLKWSDRPASLEIRASWDTVKQDQKSMPVTKESIVLYQNEAGQYWALIGLGLPVAPWVNTALEPSQIVALPSE